MVLAAQQIGDDVEIDFGADGSVLLEDTALGDLDAGDFIFA